MVNQESNKNHCLEQPSGTKIDLCPDHVGPRIKNRESPPDGLPPSLPDATIWCPMTPANPQLSTASRPRVGIPWRTTAEEDKVRARGQRGKTEDYVNAVMEAGGEAVPIPLKNQEKPRRLIPTLDAF